MMKALIQEWDQTGKNVTTLCYLAFSFVLALFMGILCVVRLMQGRYPACVMYFVLCAFSAGLYVHVTRSVRRGHPEALDACRYPLVIGMFIYGLTLLFFLDGGLHGGVSLFFVLALVATPCFVETAEAPLILLIQLAAYATNIFVSQAFPAAADTTGVNNYDLILPLILVSAALGGMCLVYTYAYRHQQDLLGHALRDADAANDAKTAFLQSMSHEIRTPLHSILGMDEMILREETRPEIEEYAVAIKTSGNALLSVLNDILDYAKLQDHNMEITPVRYDLSSLINDMVNVATEAARQKSLTFSVDIDPDIPRTLRGDEYHLRQILQNLLTNAVKFTDIGSVVLRMTHEKSGSHEILLQVSIRDTGVGIREQDMEQIFLPFEHSGSRTLKQSGAGLGLSIVRDLLALMGSDLIVDSTFRKGSTFSFSLLQEVIDPAPIGDYNAAFLHTFSQEGGYSETFLAPSATVLCVDDTNVNLVVFRNLLKKTRIHVDTASSGPEMLQLVRMRHYDCIFLDHRMPGMDGIEAFHRMRQENASLNASTPVIALTANALTGARQTYIDEGFSDYISKPVDTVRLEQLLQQFLPPEKIERRVISSEPQASESAAVSGARESSDPPASAAQPETAILPAPAPEVTVQESSAAADNPLRTLEGIDYDAAVINCGDEDTFREALSIFYETIAAKSAEIETYAEQEDWRSYTVQVHALKSSARLVGAMQLSAQALYLEDCGNQENAAEIRAGTPALLQRYRSYIDILQPLFDAGDDADKPEIRADELAELYAGIAAFAEEFDIDAIDGMLESAARYRIPDAEKEKFEKIRDAVRNIDWSALSDALQE